MAKFVMQSMKRVGVVLALVTASLAFAQSDTTSGGSTKTSSTKKHTKKHAKKAKTTSGTGDSAGTGSTTP